MGVKVRRSAAGPAPSGSWPSNAAARFLGPPLSTNSGHASSLQRTYTFNRLDGSQHRKAMQMIDGGFYDNLGLSPLLPGRSKKYTNHAYDLEYVIAIDAGIGRTAVRAPNFWPGRMKRRFGVLLDHAELAEFGLEASGRRVDLADHRHALTGGTIRPMSTTPLVTRARCQPATCDGLTRPGDTR